MQRERLNIYLLPEIRQAVEEMAGEEHSISQTIEDLLRLGLSLKRGEMIAKQSLPVVREIMRDLLAEANTQLRARLYEDMKTCEQRGSDRLAALLIRALREGLITRRMLFALLAKDDPDFAAAAFEDSRVKAGRDIASRVLDEDDAA